MVNSFFLDKFYSLQIKIAICLVVKKIFLVLPQYIYF